MKPLVVNILKFILSLLLVLCLFRMPYSYYQLVRFTSMIIFASLCLFCYKKDKLVAAGIYGSLALLFQPIFKIALSKQIWNVVDVFTAVFLIISLFNIRDFIAAVRSKVSMYRGNNGANGNSKNISVYEDNESVSLKLEIKKLEIEITSVNNEIAEIEKSIHDFGLRHQQELGKIINRILFLKKEKLEKEKHVNEAKGKAFEEAKNDYESNNRRLMESREEELFDLTEAEQKELKKNYRRATKLCHPDIVKDELKQKAESIFRDLQNAYEKNDLKSVTEILNGLENGQMFSFKSEGIVETVKLKAELNELQEKLTVLNEKLNHIKESETYTKQKLIVQLDSLEE